MNSWLRCQGSSLRQLCDEMGLHAYMNLGRTMEGCKQQIRSYFKANGARPTEKVSVEWRKMALWLQRQGTSLSRLCDEMGLPTLLNLERTKADCKREVRAYFKANGVRPTQRTSAEWGNWKHWLERQGTSLSRLCDEMGLPTIVNLERTMDDCEREVRAYFDANGKRPTLTTSAEWRKMYSWLRGRGTTLYQLCDEMGLPTLLNLERTVEGCKQEIQAYYDANGVRPSVGASVEWARWDCWLRGRSTSVSQLCDETGLPALKNLKRTMEDCTREIQAYFDANGTRPKRTSAEWGNWDGWLKRQGSSLPRYCDEMRLPKAKAKAA